MATKQLYRSRTNKILAGVCAGIAAYFEIDPTIIRVLFVLFAFFQGIGILVYVILWIVVPEATTDTASQSGFEAADIHEHGNSQFSLKNVSFAGRSLFGIIIILLGLAFLLNQIFPVHFFRWDFFWPLIVICLGLAIIFSYKRK